jgi:class 3 adenylate cyclase/DNA-binding beta-propeller fold protein YncE
MSGSPKRRLATVLFLDIVGSTAIASELGDARWRAVLASFRRVVRRELKRFDGDEQDTSGDGFFATFEGPDQALRCAAAIADAVQALGLDVRCGIHVGECEEIEGEVGGIAVHIAARAMALAGAAEVLVTGTTKDLAVGSGATFEDRGIHELKGVDGSWPVWALRSVEVELPRPLDPEIAFQRLSAVAAETRRRRRRPILAAVVGIALLGAAAAVFSAVKGAAASTPSLVRLDPATGRVVAAVHDHVLGCACGADIWAVDGTLWERTGSDGRTVAIRALKTGDLERTITLPSGTTGIAVGFGALWAELPCAVMSSAQPACTVKRFDELSGRAVASITVHGDLRNGALAAGDGAIWVLDQDGMLTRIDPATNRVSGSFDTGAVETFYLAVAGPYAWVCECFGQDDILRYDPRRRARKRFPLVHPLQTWRNNAQVTTVVPRTWLVGLDGRTGLVWFMSPAGATIIARNPVAGTPATPSIGLDGEPTQAVLARDAVWVAAGTAVDKVPFATGTKQGIAVPKGMNATGIAVDPASGAVWVANSAQPPTT